MKFDKRKDINPKYLFLTLSLICVLFLLLSFFAGRQISAVKEITVKVVSPIQKGINSIGLWFDSKLENLKEIGELNEENDKLKEEIATYKEQITIYENQLAELDSLRELYALDESYPEFNKIGARVYSKDSSSWFSTFYIDKGTDDGLFEGANVMCGDGLAGIIIECNADSSKVRSVINDSTKISAKILPSNSICTLEGNISTYEDGTLIVKNIDKDADVNEGDKVVTSHISERYHPGITIGYIDNIEYDSNNLTKTAYIRTAVDFNNINDVLVITDKPDTGGGE